jgi:putative peptidoglycan lipid II flippase
MVLAGKTQGGVTAYQFAYQFFQLPYALIAVSVASALMPDISTRWSAGDRRGFEHQFVAGLRATMALLIPIGLAYIAIAQPFIQLAIHHGRVTESSAYFLLMRAYNAMQDARSMFWMYALENGLTVVAALILEPLMGVPGLALAWVGPYTLVSVVAVADLRRKIGPMGGMRTVKSLIRVAVAGGLAALVVVGLGQAFPSHAGDLVIVMRLIVQLGVGALAYVVVAGILPRPRSTPAAGPTAGSTPGPP